MQGRKAMMAGGSTIAVQDGKCAWSTERCSAQGSGSRIFIPYTTAYQYRGVVDRDFTPPNMWIGGAFAMWWTNQGATKTTTTKQMNKNWNSRCHRHSFKARMRIVVKVEDELEVALVVWEMAAGRGESARAGMIKQA